MRASDWIGGPVVSVAAHLATLGHEMEAEDTASVSLGFASGALGERTKRPRLATRFTSTLGNEWLVRGGNFASCLGEVASAL